MRFLLSLICVTTFSGAFAQELKCNVQINSQKISGLDKRVFERLQQSVNEFMNNQAFTQDVFAPEERIECSLYIILESNPSQDVFKGSITAQSSRPVFNSSYNTPLLNVRDLDFTFTYTENTPIVFNINQYNSNLSSVLAYYAYLFIALDYESMGKNNGMKYFTILETILNQIPGDAYSGGWTQLGGNAINGDKNRYFMVTSFQNTRYSVMKTTYTDMHLNGLDLMYDKPDKAKQTILNSLQELAKIFKDNPNNVLITVFMQTKSQEFINIFSDASQGDKVKAVMLLKQLDPPNALKYDKILKG